MNEKLKDAAAMGEAADTLGAMRAIIASKDGEIATLTAECERLAEVRNAAGSVERNAVLEEAARLCETEEILFDISVWQKTKQGVSGETAFALAKAIRALKSAAPAKPEPAVAGAAFVMAPKIPTKEMLDNVAAFYTGCTNHDADLIYRAMLAAAPVAQPLAPSGAVPEPYTAPFYVHTDKHEVVSIWDSEENGLPFELNTHTQRSLDDHEGLAEELKAAQALAGFMVAGMNDLAAQPLAGQDVRAVTEVMDALRAIVADTRATYNALAEHGGPVVSIGQLGRLRRAETILAAPSPVNPKQEQK